MGDVVRIEWNDGFTLGVEVLDQQHQQLAQRLGSLIDALSEAHGAQRVTEFLSFMERYVRSHLDTEDSLMERSRYPEAARHREEHRELETTLQSFRDRLAHRGPTSVLAMEVHDRVCTWLFRHELDTDRRLAQFLRGHPA